MDCTVEDTSSCKRTLLNINYQASNVIVLIIVYRQFTERKIVHERHCCLTLLNTLPCSNSRVEFVCYIQLRELSKNSINHLSANPTK